MPETPAHTRMDPLEPWVDAAAVRRLAEQLLADSHLPEVSAAPDAGFGGDFVGFAPSSREALSVTVVSPPVMEDDAPAKPFLPEPAPPVGSPPDLQPPPGERRGPLLVRLGRFREGLVRHAGAQGVFVLDREGRPVMDDPAWGKLHFLARSLAQAYRPIEGQPGNVHVKIGANTVLEVIPVETPFGCLVLGAVVPRPLPARLVAEIATALRQAATPPEPGSTEQE